MWTKLADLFTFAVKLPSGLLIKHTTKHTSAETILYIPCSPEHADAWIAANKAP